MAHAVDNEDRDDSLDEDPDESDQDHGDDAETVPCPFCNKRVYEHADVCAHCGNYISEEDAPRRHVPALVWVGVILAGLCVLTWIFL